MHHFPIDLQDYITAFCEENKINAHLLLADGDHLRFNTEGKEHFDVTVVFTPQVISAAFATESALTMPLSGSPFDYLLKDYTMDNHLFDKIENMVSSDKKSYSINFITVSKLVRLASKGDLTAVLQIRNGTQIVSEFGDKMHDALRDLIKDMSPKFICDSITSEVMLVAMRYFQHNKLNLRSLRSVAYAHSFYLIYKGMHYVLDKTIVAPVNLKSNPFTEMAEFLKQIPIDDETKKYTISNTDLIYFQTQFKKALDFYKQEQNGIYFDDRLIPIETFFRRYIQLMTAVISVK